MKTVKHYVALKAKARARFTPGALPIYCGAMPRVDLACVPHIFLRMFIYSWVKGMSLKQKNGKKSTSLVLATLSRILCVPFWVSFLNVYVNKCILFWVPLIRGGKPYSSSEVIVHNPIIVILCWEVHCGESGLLRLWIHSKTTSCLTFETNYS